MAERIAVVTGGGQGLGYAIAQALVAADYHVAILGRRAEVLEDAAARLGRATALVADVASPTSVARAFEAVDALGGELRVLVNNAGMFIAFPIDEAPDELVQSMVQINLVGAIVCAREAARRMLKAGVGDIVNITSDAAGFAFPLLSVYGATKAGLEQLTHGLNAEFRGSDIRAMVARVGRMNTEGAAGGMAGDHRDRFYAGMVKSGAAHLSGQGMAPEVAAQAIVGALHTPRAARTEMIEVRSA